MTDSEVDVAIVGAGPYGLSLASHLNTRNIQHRIFGRPMQAWACMSPGMYLKSRGFAANIYTSQPNFDFTTYCVDRGLESVEPIEIAEFVRYGLWVQNQIIPYVEDTNVVSIARSDDRFDVVLSSGERVRARRVVNATGLTYFERMPRELQGLPSALASHTAQHGDFSPFKGKHVVVLGAGQSALQAAALLHEHGAQVEMCVRGDGIHFGSRVIDEDRALLERLRVPNSVLGHGRDNWMLEHFPMLWHYRRDEDRVHLTQTRFGPSGAWWLRDRVVDRFPVISGTSLRDATARDSGVRLRFSCTGGTEREIDADHVIAGTGYDVDVDAIPYLERSLALSVQRLVRAPRLSRHFETSVQGLYFVGPSAAFSFGPLHRFIAGADYTTKVVTRHLVRTRATRRAGARITEGPQREPALAVRTQR